MRLRLSRKGRLLDSHWLARVPIRESESTPLVNQLRRFNQLRRLHVLTQPRFVLSLGLLVTEITPGLRLLRRGLLPRNLRPGFLGAEIATWVALSPSLLPRPWWSIALGVSTAQLLGHATGSLVAHSVHKTHGPITRIVQSESTSSADILLSCMTGVLCARSLQRQRRQAKMVQGRATDVRAALFGMGAGTMGYGAGLIAGEGLQFLYGQGARMMRTPVKSVAIPAWAASIISAITIAGLLMTVSDKVVFKKLIEYLTQRAQALNMLVFQGTRQPWEPERSGSPWSFEPWTAVGSQGRAVLSGGPRARHIAKVMKRNRVHEPIRIYAGLIPGRSIEAAVEQIIQEMLRTGALHREVIVIHTSTGTGWVSDWHLDPVEFLTKGNCVNISMQYSYVPSPVAYVTERELPIRAAKALISTIVDLLDGLESRPRIYIAGESLGAYGTASAFDSLEELRHTVDGCALSGPPYFTSLVRQLADSRAPGSPERLPLIDDGRAVRFIAHPSHVDRDYQGRAYGAEWEFPRVAIVIHSSDPIVWWDPWLFIRRPDWLKEIGAAGRPAPGPMHSDVPSTMHWIPIVTGVQVALDMLIGTTCGGDHGHNYHQTMIHVWAAVLGKKMKPKRFRRIAKWVRNHSVQR